MITDPIRNADPRWVGVRVRRGTATTTATVDLRYRKGQGAIRDGTHESNLHRCTALRISLTLPCNDAGSVVE